jgi:hypothetical protein
LDARALGESDAPSFVSAAARDQFNAVVASKRVEVRAIQVDYLLSNCIARNLVSSANVTKTDDACSVR